MIPTLVLGLMLAQSAAAPPPKVESATNEKARALLSAKRIYVESFGDDPESKAIQSMVVDAIGRTTRFIVTENKDRADLLMKGAALEKTSQELHALGSGTVVSAARGGSSHAAGSGHSGFVADALGTNDSQASVETVNDARASVRLVTKDGDVVWSTTEESGGAKYKGAMADVADKIVKQLLHDLEKLQGSAEGAKY